VKDLAKMSALTYKAQDNAIYVIEDINLDVPKTKTVLGALNNMKIGDKKLMFVTPEYNDNLFMSVRNVPSILGTLLSDMNTYDIMNSEVLVLTESAAKMFVAAEEDATA
jgi:large subunit ribosomal protein L4